MNQIKKRYYSLLQQIFLLKYLEKYNHIYDVDYIEIWKKHKYQKM